MIPSPELSTSLTASGKKDGVQDNLWRMNSSDTSGPDLLVRHGISAEADFNAGPNLAARVDLSAEPNLVTGADLAIGAELTVEADQDPGVIGTKWPW